MTMLLAIDTATRLISLALHDGRAVLAETTWQSDNYHTTELAPQAALLLRRARVTADALRGLAVAIGPGSYTGLRIGLGFAKGLALAQGLPLVGVPTLDGLMRAQPPHPGPALALLAAGRGRVTAVPYAWHARRQRWEAAGPGRGLSWAELAAELAAGSPGPGQPALPPASTYVAGELDAAGLEALRPVRGAVVLAGPARALRRAGFLAEIGWERLRAHSAGDDVARLAPQYGGAPAGLVEDTAPPPAAPAASAPPAEPPSALPSAPAEPPAAPDPAS
ncbi:MAG: tRNA (adenosine(37)-N6)-threonylcarbamoyltransferase complex dimerization subunit type 1 TsaB [Anaerolineales bacterium]|nr:tRNA (adenosine(37)-N6)-threonylcarbamoyltransferase complex dimerization subunit type 1 TsaB [Anaerolineales bacterium]